MNEMISILNIADIIIALLLGQSVFVLYFFWREINKRKNQYASLECNLLQERARKSNLENAEIKYKKEIDFLRKRIARLKKLLLLKNKTIEKLTTSLKDKAKFLNTNQKLLAEAEKRLEEDREFQRKNLNAATVDLKNALTKIANSLR